MSNQNTTTIGKRVFFLYPHSVIQKEMISEIIENEYEVYMLNDHVKTIKLLRKYNDAVLYVNIDDRLNEGDWQEYIKGIMKSSDTVGVQIGIMTYDKNEDLAKKYLMEIMVPCGYIKLSLGLSESTKTILKVLDANEARGRRKYVRAICNEKTPASANVVVDGRPYNGEVKDISSVGFAVDFGGGIKFEKGTKIQQVQLRLKGTVCNVSGVILGTHSNRGFVHVVLFDQTTRSDERKKVRNFIHNTLQTQIEMEMEEL